MNKREFLKYSILYNFLVLNPTQSFASSNIQNKKFIFILLRGGMDGLSLLTPYGLDEYYSLRPNISIKKNNLLRINEKFGLHPTFKNSLFDFFNNGNVIFIPQAGQKNYSRSHFQAQDQMEYGNEKVQSESGFLNRISHYLNNSPISFTSGMPQIFKGEKLINNLDLSNYYSNINHNNKPIFDTNFQQNKELKSKFETILKTNQFIEKINNKYPEYAQSPLGQKIGIYLRESQSNIAFIEIPDWDTHVRQGVLEGVLRKRFETLNSILISLRNGLGKDWSNTCISICTEFGRTNKENGSFGTDHGHGSLMILTGGLIQNSKILGDIESLLPNHSFEGRDLNVSFDYRDILSSVLMKYYNLNQEQSSFIFPNFSRVNI